MTSSASRDTEAVRGDDGIRLIIEKRDAAVNAADLYMDDDAVARQRPKAWIFRDGRAMVKRLHKR